MCAICWVKRAKARRWADAMKEAEREAIRTARLVHPLPVFSVALGKANSWPAGGVQR